MADQLLTAPAQALVMLDRARGRSALFEHEAKSVLSCFGIATPPGRFVAAGADVEAALAGLEPPFALKIVAANVLHKTEAGGVRLGLRSPAEASDAAAAMQARLGPSIEGWLVEQMAPPGVEIVIGGTVDPSFGPNVMVGLGGVLVELFEDVCFGLCPLTRTDAQRMLDSLRGARLLRGFRGAPRLDEAAVIDALLRIGGEGGLMPTLGERIAELDINPLIVSTAGAVAVDARIVLAAAHG